MAPVKKVKRLAWLRWLLLLPIPALWCVLSHYGWLTFLENKSLDWRFQFRGELPPPVKLVYVDIDSLSMQLIGGQPWSRHIYSRVASALINEAKVKAVAFDIVFSDTGLAQSADRKTIATGNAEFGRFLLKEPPVVLAASYAGWQFHDRFDNKMKERHMPILASESRQPEQFEPPEIPSFETSPSANKKQPWTPPVPIGLIDTLHAGTRIVPLWAPNNTHTPVYYHMAVHLARLHWGLPKNALRVNGERIEFLDDAGDVYRSVPLVERQMLEINWFNRWESPHTLHVEFVGVLDEAENLLSADEKERKQAKEFFANPAFKDAIVLIGPVDKLLQDIAPTSLDEAPVPKVGVHGNVLSTIVSGKYLARFSPRATYLVVFGFSILITILAVAGGARALLAKVVAMLALVGYAGITFHLFTESHLVLPFAAPLGAALSTSFAGLIMQIVDEQKAKGRIKGMFGAYVSPQLVERMVESGDDPQLGGHEEEITAYFSDIQGFSAFSEKLPPAKLVELMNEYLTACTDIVTAQGGTLDKYIGDAVVAMFGAPIPLPDHAYRACIATQLVHRKLGELRAKWKSEGDKWPEIVWKMQSRIGLNSGPATIGNMGSRTRFNYTMMGDNVNLAARMESGAKSWGAYTMVTQATKDACEQHGDRVVFRALNKIQVMGRSQAVPIYEIVGLRDSLPPTALECIGLFEQALAKYYARDWDGAIALFKQSAPLEPNQPGKTPGVKTNPSLRCIEVAEEKKANPPASDWDGRYVMTEK